MRAALILAGALAIPALAIEVTGRVMEYRSGTPVDDARVTFRYVDAQPRTAEARTDDDGRFSLRIASRGRCRIEVAKRGYASSMLFAAVEGDLSVVVRMIKGGVISGRVMDESAAPVAGQTVILLRELSNGSFVRGESATHADIQGAYRLFGLLPGRYAVAAVSSMSQLLSIVAGEEHSNIDLTVPTTLSTNIDGRVERVPGEGTVMLALLPRDLPAAPIAKVVMDRDGAFHFRGVPAGSYVLFSAAPSLGTSGLAGILGPNPAFARVELEASGESAQNVRLQMQAGRTVSFQLTGRDKKPACSPSGTLLLTSLEAWGVQADRRAEVVAAAPVAMRDLAPARYAARVTGLRDGCFSSGESIVDLAGDVPAVIPLQVSGEANIRGKMLASGADSSSHALILLWPNPGAFHDAGLIVILSDTSGDFEANALQPGVYRLLAARQEEWSNPEWKPDLSGTVEIELSSGTTDAQIPMPAQTFVLPR
jgi:hypothetical protein